MQVVRCLQRGDAFEIAVKTIKVSKQDMNMIIDYAVNHMEG